MMRTVTFSIVVLVLLAAVFSVGSAGAQPAKPADAPTLKLELARLSLQNVEDQAGRWQFEGGKVMQDGKQVATYATVRRIVNKSTEEQNAAMLTTTIFFLGEKPPQNITLQGSHDFNSGGQVGSVSAASGKYSAYIGKSFSTLESKKLTIN